jgi:hypothetical protein
MAKALPLPDGTTVAIREGETPAQTWARAQQMYPEAFGNVPEKPAGPGPESGFTPALKSGYSGLKSGLAALAGKTGIMDEEAASKYMQEQEEYQKKTFKPTQTFGEAPVTKTLELLGGSLPYMAAPLVAGAAAGSAPVSGALGLGALGASILGGTAAGAASAAQFTGSNLQRQLDENKNLTLGQADLGAAALAAIPQAALDVISLKMLPGIRKILSAGGAEVSGAAAKKFAEQGIKEIAKDYAAATGKAMGTEALTEAGQQVLERAQAGLNLTDEKARTEYWDSMVGGAVLGGVLSPAGRYVERRGEADKQDKEAQVAKREARAEEQRVAAQTAAKEEAFKQSPDYALKVADDYAAAEKAKADLLAQKRKIVKGSPTETADVAFNTTISKQLQEQAPALKALGAEYARLEPTIKQATEQKRIEALTPEEYSLEQMQAAVAGAVPRRTRDERLAALNQPIPEEEGAPEAAYAAERLALARAQNTFTGDISVDVLDYVDYLMADPRMAQAIVENQTPLAGLDRKEQNAVRGALKLQLLAVEKQRVAAGEAGTAASQARVGTVEEEEQAALEAQRVADEAEATRMETERADAQRTARLAPEVEGLKRLGKVPEGAFSSANADAIFRDMYLKQADEQRVDQLLSTLPMSSITTPGKIYAGLGFETASRRDLLTRIAVAKAHTGTEDVAQLREALAKLDAEAGSKANMSERLPGEGLLPEAEKKTIAAEKLADQQSRTLQEYIQFLEDKKRGKPRGTLRLGRKERLETAGDEFKAAYAKQHVDEVNARLDAFGLPQLTETEAKIATGRVMRNLNELGERWTASSAAAPGLGTFAAPVKAMEVLQEQIRSGMFKTINDAAERANLVRRGEKAGKTRTAEGGARIATPDELKLRAESTVPKDDKRIATELATQLRDTLDQRTYARPEQPAPKGKEGSNRADMALAFGAQERGMRADIASRAESLDEDTKDFVRRAADTLDQIKDEALITRLKEGLQDVAEGRKVSALTQQELKDFVATRAKDVQSTTRPGATPEELQRTSAQPQMSLAGFDEVGERTQRATPKNFQKMLDSKDVQGMRAAIAKMRTDNIVAIQEAARSTPAALRAARTAKARVAYNAALAQEQKNSSVVSKLKAVFTEERAGAREVVDALQNQLVGLQKRIDEVAEVRSMLGKETNDMALMIQAPSVLGQEKALQKRLKETQTALDFAKDLVVAVDKQTAASATLYDMLTKEVTTTTEVRRTRETGGRFQAYEKQQRRVEQAVEDARKELSAAERAERETAVEVKETKSVQSEFRDAAQRAREGLDLPGLRSTVDTTKMQVQINNIRSAMGSLNALVETETDPVKKAEYQKRLDATAAKLETVYADAPRITTAIAEKDQLLFEQTFDDVHIAAYDKQMAKGRIKEGEYGPALTNRRRGAVARSGPLTVQTGEKKATPASEMAGSALERVAQERAALRELEDRVAFLRANGKDKVKGRLTDAFKAVQEKVAAQKVVVQETEEAQKATVAAVRDINKEERAEKARVRKAEVKAEDDGVVFRTTTRGGPTLATEEVSAIAERITADWKNAPEIVVVATENELPLRILGLLVKREATKNTPGLFDIPSGKVYLIASNLRSAKDVVLTVAHEATGHFGLRDLLGGDYTRTMDNLYAGNPDVRKQANAKLVKEPALTQQIAVEEVLADMAETGGVTPAEKSALRRIYEVLRNWFRTTFKLPNVTDAEVQQLVTNARKQVIEGGIAAEGKAPEGGILRRTGPAKYSEENALTDLANKAVASPKSFKERLGNNIALEAEMNTVDMRAGVRESLQRGAAAMGDDKLFTQAMYNVRKADQYMPMVQTIMTSGPVEMFTDEKGIKGWRSTNKNSAGDVFARVAEVPVGNAQAKMNIATVYMIAQRVANKGLAKLDIGALGITQPEIDAAMAAVEADPELKRSLEAVRTEYNAFNAGLINSLAVAGAIPKAVAAKLLKDGDYVPFYRVNENGMADLVFNDEVTINIGDIRHQPYLAELKGGEAKIMPLDESLPRNTLLLTQKMLTNTATKSIAYAMQAFGEGKGPVDKSGKPTNAMPIHKGSAPAGSDIITFNQEPDVNDPKDKGLRWQRIQTAGTAMEGIPAELVVKSLEGAHLTLPAFLKIGGIASDMLRAGVTRMPMYLARQLIRDPMAASFTGGLNYGPLTAVAKAGKEFIAMSRGTSETGAKLLEKGLIQSGIFTGDASDLSKMALQIASGKDQSFLDKLFAKLDRAAMRADAATRTQVYDNAIANGLSENEADLMTMESMNFYKRGLSPTVQYATRLIPFFNAQIQGLNVLYKAARGQMPFEEQQQIKRKFFNNAMLLVGTGLVYAMAMEDDEYFKNAKPKDKYSNFFLPVPGIKEPFKLPIPYEAGWFFSLAVAAVDAMKAQTDGKQQWQALRDMFLSSVPGYSSAGMPQAVKPLFELWTNKNYFSGNAIESARMERLSPQERFGAATTEAAKALSKALPLLSPVQIEHLATGYFGQLPLVIAGAADGLFRRDGAAPEKRITEMPFIGQAFQKQFGGADTDVMYRDATTAIQAKTTFDKIRKEGRAEDAKEFFADNRVEIASAGLARNYQTQMGRLRTDAERVGANTNMSAQEKRARLDKIEEARQSIADRYRAALKRIEQAVDKTTPR